MVVLLSVSMETGFLYYDRSTMFPWRQTLCTMIVLLSVTMETGFLYYDHPAVCDYGDRLSVL